AESPAKNVKDMVALARTNVRKCNCGPPAIGTTPQLLLELFKMRENLPKLADVVFKGGGDAVQALLTGTVELSVGSLGAALPHIKAGTFRCLAICGDTRWPELPAVPTMQQAGYNRFSIG